MFLPRAPVNTDYKLGNPAVLASAKNGGASGMGGAKLMANTGSNLLAIDTILAHPGGRALESRNAGFAPRWPLQNPPTFGHPKSPRQDV